MTIEVIIIFARVLALLLRLIRPDLLAVQIVVIFLLVSPSLIAALFFELLDPENN